jgi:hypothetical protein
MPRFSRIIAALFVLASAACIDSTRVNAHCAWSDPVTNALDLRRSEDREHLRQDAQLAWELSVRYGDTRFRTEPQLARPFRRECRRALEDSIIARHAVTEGDVRTATHWRVWWVELVAVILPMMLLALVASHWVTYRLTTRADREQRWASVTRTIVAAAIVALVVAGLSQCWATIVECIRLHDGHVADRVTVLPSIAHMNATFAVAFVLCLISATRPYWFQQIRQLRGHRR